MWVMTRDGTRQIPEEAQMLLQDVVHASTLRPFKSKEDLTKHVLPKRWEARLHEYSEELLRQEPPSWQSGTDSSEE